MVEVRPLLGVRFDSRRSGPVGPLIAPPYDVAAPDAAATFSIRQIEGVDLGAGASNHALAAERYRDWLDRGVLVRDTEPSIYIHRHEFVNGHSPVTRTGILARVRLRAWSDGVVLPHERTNPGPRQERLGRLRAVGANLSPLYFLFRDPDRTIRELVAEQAWGIRDEESEDQMGGSHTVLPITDPRFHERFSQVFAGRTLFVADGHHRYEAALAYRDECRAAGRTPGDAPSDYVLALLAAVEDPGVVVRPTHRVLVGKDAIPPESILAMARTWFDVRAASGPPRRDDGIVGRLVLPQRSGTWDVFARAGRPHLALLPRDRGDAWRSLAVSSVQGLFEALLDSEALGNDPHLTPVVDVDEAVRLVDHGEAHAAFLLPDPSLDRLLAVAEEGDLLPPKSTWFEPKAPAGLVINDLRE